MKKLLIKLTILVTLVSSAYADFTRVELGGGSWNQASSGTLTYTDAATVSGTYTASPKELAGSYAWMMIKHPLPVVPNFRFEYTSLQSEGLVSGKFQGFTAPVGTAATLSLTEVDVIPYYNLLDNTFWLTLDVGIDIKSIQAKYEADNVTNNVTNLTSTNGDSISFIVPMLYIRTRVEIPTTDIGIEADVKYVSYNGSTVYDTKLKVDYTLAFVPVVQPAIEFGYRVQNFDVTSDDKKTKTKLNFSGLYVGLMLRF